MNLTREFHTIRIIIIVIVNYVFRLPLNFICFMNTSYESSSCCWTLTWYFDVTNGKRFFPHCNFLATCNYVITCYMFKRDNRCFQALTSDINSLIFSIVFFSFLLIFFFSFSFLSFFFYRSACGRNCGGSWARVLPPSHPAAKDTRQRDIHEVSGDVVPINMVKGIGHLRDPRLNKV